MSIDPVTAAAVTAAITKTTSWLWDKYGKDLLSRLGKEGKKEWDQHKWQKSAEKYLNNLYDDVSTLRVLGKSENQSIEQMYTDVNVLGELSAERRVKLAQLPDEYEERVGLRWQQKEERQDGLKLAHETKRLFILGKPGAGKTTFLKHIALQTIKGQIGEKIPIFIGLWRLANSGEALMPYIVEQFRICGFPEAEPFVREVLNDGRAIVLFDGLDEVRVENEQRDRLITAVEDFGREFRDSQVFITCRLAVTDYTFDGFKYVEMADFNQEQMQTFVFRWFQKDKAQRDACWEALQADRNKTLRELAQVPLLLSLLCLTYEKRNEFPQERDEIYKEATDALLNDWDASRRIKRGREFIRENAVYETLTLKHKQKLLAHVAAQTFADGQYFIEEEKLAGITETFLRGVPGLKDKEVDGVQVLRVMESQHGIFVERARGIHSFCHLTLQEYYVARYIVENEASDTLPRLMAHMGEDRWREVFLLTASMLSDATEFCKLNLNAMQQIASVDEVVTSFLQWATEKSTQFDKTDSGISSTSRAIYIFLGLSLSRTFALACDLSLSRNPSLTRDLILTRDLARARSLALDRAYNLSYNLAHADSLDLPLDLDRVHALARSNTFNVESTLNRNSVFALDLNSYPLLALDYRLSRLVQLVQILAAVGATAVKEEVLVELRESIFQINQVCEDAKLPELGATLTTILLPTNHTSDAELSAIATQLSEILLAHRDLGRDWNLSKAQIAWLEKYLQANLLFRECLNLAYVPGRAAIENQMLLPPSPPSGETAA